MERRPADGMLLGIEPQMGNSALMCRVADITSDSSCNASNKEYQRAVVEAMKRHPRFGEWEGIERACIEGIERGRRAAAPKAGMSAARERALERIAFVNAGGDVTSYQWTDRLASAGGRKPRIRYHRAG